MEELLFVEKLEIWAGAEFGYWPNLLNLTFLPSFVDFGPLKILVFRFQHLELGFQILNLRSLDLHEVIFFSQPVFFVET